MINIVHTSAIWTMNHMIDRSEISLVFIWIIWLLILLQFSLVEYISALFTPTFLPVCILFGIPKLPFSKLTVRPIYQAWIGLEEHHFHSKWAISMYRVELFFCQWVSPSSSLIQWSYLIDSSWKITIIPSYSHDLPILSLKQNTMWVHKNS